MIKKRNLVMIVVVLGLIGLRAEGQITFQKTYGVNADDIGYSVIQTYDGGYAITGTIGTNNYDVFLVKTDSFGDTLWTKSYGGIHADYGYSIIQTNDSGYIIVGSTESFDADVYVIRTDSLGDTLWTRIYGGGSDDEAN